MPQRGFSTSYWTDPFILKLPQEAKLLYAYLWTNIHCNQAGLYEIALETIAFETALPPEDVPRLIRLLEPKVAWYPDGNLIWVKNFLRHQTKSPKFLAAAAKCLSSIHNNGLVKEFLDFNQQHNVFIPYQYPKATVAIPDSGTDTHTAAVTDTNSDSGGGGEEDNELAEISQLYEANIGMLTPIVAERLIDVRASIRQAGLQQRLKKRWLLSTAISSTSKPYSSVGKRRASGATEETRKDRQVESIEGILSRIHSRTNGGRRQMNQKIQVEQCLCRTCGAPFEGEVTTYLMGGREREFRPWECPTCKEKREAEEAAEREEYLRVARAEQRERWRKLSSIPGYLLTRTFDSFQAGCQDKALKNCHRYAEEFDLDNPTGYRSLILYSPKPGVGKTHLMVAVANYVIDHWNGEPGQIYRPIVFERGPGLVRRIRATYNLRDGDNYHEREENIYNELRGAKLLLLDDVGKEKPSDFTRELYWYLIDERVTSGLPVVMTCRLSLDSLAELMGEDTVDRLYGMTGGQAETLTGESYRKQKRVA